MCDEVRDTNLLYVMGEAVLVFSQKVIEIRRYLDIVEKEK